MRNLRMRSPRLVVPVIALLIAVLAPAILFSQTSPTEGLPPVPPDSAAAPTVEELAPGANPEEGIEVLTRGPLHEAFAAPIDQDPQPGQLVEAAPPEPIEELPPEVKPDGENVEWVPGYWAWDEDEERFIWISGVWRAIPPGREWVPGYWAQEADGHRWISGYWAASAPAAGSQVAESVFRAAQEAQSYVAPPPETLDVGPTSPQPSEQHFWVPGCWIYADVEYRWRPGYWYEYQPDWVWVPDHYVWTPAGCLFVPGYWDYTLQARGLAFAPVYFTQPVYTRPHYYYRPHFALQAASLALHLFVHPHNRFYCYGDFYGARYAGLGYRPWFQFSYFSGGGFGYSRYYNPLLTYYGTHFRRHGIDYVDRLRGWHRYYDRHEHHRPPRKYYGSKGIDRTGRGRSPYHHVLARSVDEVRQDWRGSGRRVVDVDRNEVTREQMRRRVDAAREVARARQAMERDTDAPRQFERERDSRRTIVRGDSGVRIRDGETRSEAGREQFRQALERSRELARNARDADRSRSRVEVPSGQERDRPSIVRGQQPNRRQEANRGVVDSARQRVLRMGPTPRRETAEPVQQARDLARERLRTWQQRQPGQEFRSNARTEVGPSGTADRARRAAEAAREAQQSIIARQRSVEALRERQRIESRSRDLSAPSGRIQAGRSGPSILGRSGGEAISPRPQVERFQRPTQRATPQTTPRQLDRARSFARERAQVQSRAVERAVPQARSRSIEPSARTNQWRGGRSSASATMQRGPSVRVERSAPTFGNRGNSAARGNSGGGRGRGGR